MNRTGSIIVFTLLRLAVFGVPLAILLLLDINPWLSVVFATLIGFSLSILLLSPLRERLSATLQESRQKEADATAAGPKPGSDEAAEDFD